MKEKEINQISMVNYDLDEVEIVLGDKFELKIEDGKYYAVRKKPVYPKTLPDCCKMINNIGDYQLRGYKHRVLFDFQNLLICRDAYWKIAGERMGLDKPWEPDWRDERLDKYCIYCDRGDIKKGIWCQHHYILAFPTEEMRDVFYENFKELIEYCKELL